MHLIAESLVMLQAIFILMKSLLLFGKIIGEDKLYLFGDSVVYRHITRLVCRAFGSLGG